MKLVYWDVIRLKTTETLQTLIPMLRKSFCFMNAFVGGYFDSRRESS